MSRDGAVAVRRRRPRRGRDLQPRADRRRNRRPLPGELRHQPAADGVVHDLAANPVATGQPVTFDASGSTDPDGTIVKYEWDLDGNGTYETNTGSTADDHEDLRRTQAIQVGAARHRQRGAARDARRRR